MTEEKKAPERKSSSARNIARSIRRHLVNYVFIAIAGTMIVTCASTMAKAYWVKRPLEKADAYLSDNKLDELLQALDKTSRWEELFPSLKPRRNTIAIRCYARKNEIGKAMGIADAMVTSSSQTETVMDFVRGFVPPDTVTTLVDRFSYFINHMEKPLATLINAKFSKQNTALSLSAWSGYDYLTKELKAANNKAGLESVLKTCREYHPEASFTLSLSNFMAGIKGSGRDIPHPDSEAPIGWAVVKAEKTSLYDKSGSFLARASRGSLIEVDEMRDSKSGEIVIGSLKYRNSQTPGVVALAKDLTLKRGLLFELDPALMDKLYTRAELARRLVEAQESAKRNAANANPHAAAYKQALEEYRALKSKSDEITAKFKTATGPEREKYANELRLLKPKSVGVINKYKAAKSKHDAWEKANGGRTVTSPEVTNLTAQLNQIEAELRQLGHL